EAPRCALLWKSTAGKSAEAAMPVLPRACSTRAAAAARSRLFCWAEVSSVVSSGLWNPAHQVVVGHVVAPSGSGDENACGISDVLSAVGGSVPEQAAKASVETPRRAKHSNFFMESLTEAQNPRL